MSPAKVSAACVRQMKGREKIAALTAYDYPTARLLDECGVPLLLVGDSLGMVVLGYPDTTHVTMQEMLHHTRAVARACPGALIVADLPFGSYETPGAGVANARRLVEAGAEAVKAEGGRAIAGQARAIVDAGIPFMGHLGMLPQHVREEGGYHIKGKSDEERDALHHDADALEAAGVFAIVLELVAPPVARELTARMAVPTIGIGSGADCDGQILVTSDLFGTSPGRIPRHVQPSRLGDAMRAAVAAWKAGL